MRLIPILAVLLAVTAGCGADRPAASVRVILPETNGATAPLGVDDPAPRFSWRLNTTDNVRGLRQQRARLRVTTGDSSAATTVWESGWVDTADPWLGYAGPELASRTRYQWTVQVETSLGASDWSDAATFETGLAADDWQARWIAGPERPGKPTPEQGAADDAVIEAAEEFCRPPDWPTSGFFITGHDDNQGRCREIRPAPMLRHDFDVEKPVASARLYAAGLGYGELALNGQAVSDNRLDPAFSTYSHSVYYVTHDVTDLVDQGANTIAAILGSGQFDSAAQTWDWGWEIAAWRTTPQLLLQLEITYGDGSRDVVTSNGDWRVSIDGPWRYDSFYLGETYDARREITNWNMPTFDDSGWPAVRVVEAPAGDLRSQQHEPIRVVASRGPGQRLPTAPGIHVYDTGQNLSGWAEIAVDAPAGTPIEVFYSEKLGDDGLLSDDVAFTLVGGQLQTDYYVASGGGAETFTPRFSYKGFRYVQISAPGGEPLGDDVTVALNRVEHLRTGFAGSGNFTSSEALLERIHTNTRWAVASNVMGIVTDTPIYEKNGWTGDAQLSAGIIALMFDAERLYRKQVQDMIDNQLPTGEVPLLAPSNENYGYVGKPAFKPVDCCGATPAWDAMWFVVPWEAWMRYGDRRYLERSYPGMKSYLDDWIPEWTGRDGDGFDHTLTAGLGDWDPPEGTPTNIHLATTAYYAFLTSIAADTAAALGESADEARYRQLFETIREQFNERFLADEGFYRNQPDDGFTQTAQALPLAFDLVPDELRADLAKRLADDVAARGHHPWVGVLGARYLLPVLSDAGYDATALAVATQTAYPSWGYWIEELGWTALGEFWEDTSRSRSHHFFGTIVQWFYEGLAGIEPLEPGFGRIRFQPMIADGPDRVAASYESVRGIVESRWERGDEATELFIAVPPTATGDLVLPPMAIAGLAESGSGETLPAGSAPGVSVLRDDADALVLELESGNYRFVIPR